MQDPRPATEFCRPSLALELHKKYRSDIRPVSTFHFAPQPNWGFNPDANIGHGFAIFMAYVGTLRTSCSGAG